MTFLEVVERKIVEDKVEEAKQKLKSGEKQLSILILY